MVEDHRAARHRPRPTTRRPSVAGRSRSVGRAGSRRRRGSGWRRRSRAGSVRTPRETAVAGEHRPDRRFHLLGGRAEREGAAQTAGRVDQVDVGGVAHRVGVGPIGRDPRVTHAPGVRRRPDPISPTRSTSVNPGGRYAAVLLEPGRRVALGIDRDEDRPAAAADVGQDPADDPDGRRADVRAMGVAEEHEDGRRRGARRARTAARRRRRVRSAPRRGTVAYRNERASGVADGRSRAGRRGCRR